VGDEREQAPAHGGGQAQEGEPDLLGRREEGARHVQVTLPSSPHANFLLFEESHEKH